MGVEVDEDEITVQKLPTPAIDSTRRQKVATKSYLRIEATQSLAFMNGMPGQQSVMGFGKVVAMDEFDLDASSLRMSNVSALTIFERAVAQS